jgi:pimeloyl-ACP methyl ester carboxylesterase
MRSPALAIVWEIGRKNSWTFRLVFAAVPACALLYRLLAGPLRSSELLLGLSLLPLVLSLLGVFSAFNYTETSSRSGLAGYPARLFTLPVGTRLLVTCPILCGTVTVVALYLVWATLVLPPLGVLLPVARPALFLAAGMVCYQSAIWGLAGFRLTRLMVMGVVGAGFFGVAFIASLPEVARTCPWPIDALLAVGLAAVALVAYGWALLGVERQRRGGGRGRAWWRAGVRAVVDLLPRRRRPFASPHQALCWLAWRRGGVVLPACVGFVLVLVVGPVLWLVGSSPEVTFSTLFWVAVLPLLLAAVVGLGFARPDFWARELALPTFLAVRPVRSGDLVLARLTVAAHSTLAAWALVLTITPLWLALGCDTSLVAKFAEALGRHYPLLALLPLGLLAALLLTWRLLVGSLPVGLAGRQGLFLASVCAGTACVLAFIVAFAWSLTRPEPWQTRANIAGRFKEFFESIPEIAWLLYAAFLLKLWGAVWSWTAARRRGLVSDRAAGAYLVFWSTATAALMALLGLLLSPAAEDAFGFPFNVLIHAGWLPYLLLLGCLLVVPLARVPLAALALARNRHGSRAAGEVRGEPLAGPASKRKDLLIPLAAAASALAALLPLQVGERYGRRVAAGGHRLRLRVLGAGSPTVVLESHGMAPLEAWAKVQPQVAAFSRVVAYDHAGYWGSRSGPRPRDARRIVEELHTALGKAGIAPPYVLVGHSFGGPYVRVFAAHYPRAVAGLVLVDPTQEEAMEWLRARHPELNHVSTQERTAQTEFGCSWDSLAQARAAWPLPDVPVTLLTCLRSDGSRLAAEFLPIWLDSHRRWLARVPGATHLILPESGHGIVLEDPERVTDAIRQVVAEARRRSQGKRVR